MSENHVAAFPWEPAPVPQPIINPGPVPSNASRPQPLSSSNASTAPNIPISSSGNGNVHIKTEPGTGYDANGLPPNSAPSTYSNPTAMQRAGQQLAEKFGESAAAQVNQLQARAALAGQANQPQRSSSGQATAQLTEEQRRRVHEQQRQLYEQQRRQQAHYQSLQSAQQRAAVNNTQTDGAGDWEAMVAQRRADALDGELKRIEADLTIRQQVEQMSHEMEGGGLMLPLSARSKQPVPKKRKVTSSSTTKLSEDNLLAAQLATPHKVSRVPQLDGPDDTDEDDKAGIKDEDDEDAINSDLDDSDDNAPDDTAEDGTVGNIMLCTYDKVQRVKNKWKCTLKDGVLNTGDKE